MTTSCELCGRGMDRKTLLPYWWPYEYVCERRSCRAAAVDAIVTIRAARDEYQGLVGAVAERHEAQYASHGWRGDTMAKIAEIDEEDWWATEITKEGV